MQVMDTWTKTSSQKPNPTSASNRRPHTGLLVRTVTDSVAIPLATSLSPSPSFRPGSSSTAAASARTDSRTLSAMAVAHDTSVAWVTRKRFLRGKHPRDKGCITNGGPRRAGLHVYGLHLHIWESVWRDEAMRVVYTSRGV